MGNDSRLRELVAALKHDLAKYVAWRSANFGGEAWNGELSEEFADALQSDVLRTRGEEPAWVVWAQFVERWTEQSMQAPPAQAHPELRAVEAAVGQLKAVEPALRLGRGAELAAARTTIQTAQQAIRSELRTLHRRLMQAG